MDQRRHFITISALGAAESTYVSELSASLLQLGHGMEIWTVRCGDQPAAERLANGVLVRRFRAQRDYLVPRARPCGWVSEWVARAIEHVADAPAVVATLVTHQWEAGVAGRSLAGRFGFAHVHVPHVPDLHALDHPSGERTETDSCWRAARRLEEDGETCRAASVVVATSLRERDVLVGGRYGVPADRVAVVPPGRDIGRRFAAALPPARDGPGGFALASPGIDGASSIDLVPGRRGPWYMGGATAV